MNELTEKLNASNSSIRKAPTQFSGQFRDFFYLHVSPNLPSKERVLEFDILLENYLSSSQPFHLIRKVASLERQKTFNTSEGHLLLASDNSPAWWLHAFLLSRLPLPSDMGKFVRNIPRHMFDIKLSNNLSKAGFHLAHLSNVKNRDTNWKDWNKEELERRMRLNIHPWNWCLIAKECWRIFGANEDIIGFIDQEYIERYGAPYVQWRRRHPLNVNYNSEEAIPYSYGSQRNQEERQIKSVVMGQGIQSTRPIIQAKWIGKGIILNLRLQLGNYYIQHDELLKWIEHNTTALKTKSWTEGKVFHWPRPSRKMAAFLEPFRSE